jgi:chlorite dismutase
LRWLAKAGRVYQSVAEILAEAAYNENKNHIYTQLGLEHMGRFICFYPGKR